MFYISCVVGEGNHRHSSPTSTGLHATNSVMLFMFEDFNRDLFSSLDKSNHKNKQTETNRHAQYIGSRQNKLIPLWILTASARGLLWDALHNTFCRLWPMIVISQNRSAHFPVTCHEKVRPAWRGVQSLLDLAYGDVECGIIIKWSPPTGSKE